MIVPDRFRLKNIIKQPTTLIVGGMHALGLEIAESLITQGGYVVLVDVVSEENVATLDARFSNTSLLSFLDYTAIPHIEEDIRRLDYVFYCNHESIDFRSEVSTQEFLTFSNYLDAALTAAASFEARFLLTTSIKAQQLLYTENLFYNKKMGSSFTQTYTDMEVQRYAEGLVMEYHEKVGLDARIVRLGQIIGEGMDFSLQSKFNELVLQAAHGEHLVLYNDGLEQEWFVHVLDAAYGIIKAQFSKETNGNYYSLCYDTTYTHLSIAYKIQEIADSAQEIQFVDHDDPTPPIKLQKPAPNLSNIGWMPRVPFDKAVTQSVAAASLFVAENTLNENDTSSKDGVQGFLDIASKGDGITMRIAQRKAQENKKKQSVLFAGKQAQSRKFSRKITFGQRVRNTLWGFARAGGSFFGFFSKKSPLEIGVYLALITVGLFIYITLLAPALVLGRNVVIAFPAGEEMVTAIKNRDFESAYAEALRAQQAFTDVNDQPDAFTTVAQFVSQEDELENVYALFDAYTDYFSGMEKILFAYEAFDTYLSTYQSNVQLRNGTETYLATTNNGLDISEQLDTIEARTAFVERGIQEANDALNRIVTIDTTALPDFIQTRIDTFSNQLNTTRGFIQQAPILTALPNAVGNSEPITYLVFFVDPTRPTPIGGSITSIMQLTLRNGSIQDIQLQDRDAVAFSVNNAIAQDEARTNTNARRFRYITASDIQTLETIQQPELFLETVSTSSLVTDENSFGGAALVNVSFFAEMLQNIDIQPSIGGISLSSQTLFTDIVQALDIESGAARDQVISELASYLVIDILESLVLREDTAEMTLGEGLQTSEIQFFATNPTQPFAQALYEDSIEPQQVFETSYWIAPSFLSIDDKLFDGTQVPDIAMTVTSTIANNFVITNSATLDFPAIGTVQEVGFCFPRSTDRSSIQFEGIPLSRTVINQSEHEMCAIAQAAGETRLTITWNAPLPVLETGDTTQLTLGVPHIPGAITRLDYTIDVSNAFDIVDVSPEVSPQDNEIVIAETIRENLLISLEVE